MKKFVNFFGQMAFACVVFVLASCASSGMQKIDSDLANADAAIHRPDGIQKSEFNSSEKPKVRAVKKNNVPNRIVVTINGDPATTRGFNWFTSDNLKSFVELSTDKNFRSNVLKFDAKSSKKESHYLERDVNGFFIYKLIDTKNKTVKKYFTDAGRAKDWSADLEVSNWDTEDIAIDVVKVNEYAYSANATGLKPNTTYYYKITADGNVKTGEFKTASNRKDAFTFLHYTDTQNAYWNEHLIDEAKYCANTLEVALDTARNADFVLHTGDIVEIAEVEDEWVDLFTKSEKSFLKTTMVPLAGNHDEYGLSYDERFTEKFNDHFNVPAEGPIDGGSYYSFDYNGVHFIQLNTNDYKNAENKALGKEQLAWLKKDVNAARKRGCNWVILSYHKPIFSKSYHSLQDTDVQNVRDDFMKLIDELDIDLALQGHDHVVSRTKSLKYVPKTESVFNAKVAEIAKKEKGIDTITNPKGTTFLLPNTGGTKAYDDIYSKGLAHVKKVRPKLSWLTQVQLDEYLNLFAYGEQPFKTKDFDKSHSNNRDSTVQNFAKYEVTANSITCYLYQIAGEIGVDKRNAKLVDSFKIVKN